MLNLLSSTTELNPFINLHVSRFRVDSLMSCDVLTFSERVTSGCFSVCVCVLRLYDYDYNKFLSDVLEWCTRHTVSVC